MSAGTLKLTNNSTAVVGTSTLFTTDLKPGDFITATIGGVLYTLPVDTVTSNTAATLVSPFTGPTTTGAAWAAVPRKTMNQVTAELVNQSTAAIRALLAEKGNWMNFYTAPGDISIQPGDSAPAVSGPGWQKMAGLVGSSQQVRGELPAAANLNKYGPTAAFTGIWMQSMSNNAQLASNFPEPNAIGFLEVFAGGQWGGTQRYTVRNGNIYVRSLTASWNGSDGPWSDWSSITTALNGKADKVGGAVPIAQGGTGATTQATALAALLGSSAVPVANGGTGATTVAAARGALGLEYGTTAGTVAVGNDTRLGTVNGKSGGSITGTVDAVIASAEPAFRSPSAATYAQGPNQYRNVFSHIVMGDPNQVVAQDAYGDTTTFMARTIIQTAPGQFKMFTYDFNGNAAAPGSWVNNSDERLKTNIARVSEPLKKMRMLRGVTWDRVDGVPSGQGFIAQELKRVFPTAVFNSGEKLLPNGELLSDVLSVDLAGAAAALHHEAILALMDKNEAQQAEIAALKSDLEELKKIVEGLITK